MVTLPMDLFSMGGLEFGISFVSKEDTLNDLRSIAGQHGFKLIFVNKTDDGDAVTILARKDENEEYPDVNGLLTIIRKQDRWVPQMEKYEDIHMLVIFNKEVLS